MDRRTFILFAALSALLPTVRGQCQIAGVGAWDFPHPVQILDIDRDEIFRGATTNINSIQSSQHSGDALNRGPYFTAELQGGDFVLRMSDAFAEYEEYEYSFTMSIQVVFACAGGATSSLIINIQVQDTNNNSPRFVPSDSFTFSIIPPIVPGYELTACFGDIVARDIDLTTQSIVFSIEDNPYFEIDYGGRDPADAKNFFAVLRAISVIRSLAEPLVLAITAQDVDLTGDPPRTSPGTITIEASAEYELPAEPVFSQPFYTATYSADHAIILHQTISLAQGYDDQVIFTLSGDYEDYFTLTPLGNSVTIQVAESLEAAIIAESGHLVLVVDATREHTSGATATLIVDLPPTRMYRFEEPSYTGTLDGSELQIAPITLVEVYEEDVTLTLYGDYEVNFQASITGNSVTIELLYPLDEDAVEANTYVILILEASGSGVAAATTVITVEIIKREITIPVFSQYVYTGLYHETETIIENINLSQGYDETVEFELVGEYAPYLRTEINGNSVNILVETPIPAETLATNTRLLFSLVVHKPGTVGANAALNVESPTVSGPQFTQLSFEGVILDNVLALPPLTLSEIGSGDITASVIGLHSEYFSAEVTGAAVAVSMSPLPDAVIQQNNFVSVEVLVSSDSAAGASSASAVLLLDIVKEDTTTPVFTQEIYSSSDSSPGGLQPLVVSLAQGFDETVQFSIDGDGSEYFTIDSSGGNSAELVLAVDLPPEVVTGQQHLLFSVRATKPRTVGATAAVSFSMPPRMYRFEEPSYTGTLDGSELQIAPITLVEVYEEDVTLTLYGDYEVNFQASITGNSVTIELLDPLDEDAVEANTYVILILEASGSGVAAATTVITVEIIKREITTPVFSQYVYTGLYHETETIIENINLSQGYDETVEFELVGEYAPYLRTEINGNSVNILVETPIPAETLATNTRLFVSLVVHKPGTVGANAALNVESPTARMYRFEEPSYTGTLDGSELQIAPITLVEVYEEDVTLTLYGDYEVNFQASITGNSVTIELLDPLDEDAVEANTYVILILEASGSGVAAATTVITVEIIKREITTPVFSQYVYTGLYHETETIIENINLSQGYDETVEFELVGEYAPYLRTEINGNSVNILVETPIPAETLATNTRLLFSLVVHKPGTVGANAALNVESPTVRFAIKLTTLQAESQAQLVKYINITDSVVPVFGEPFYSGSYNEENGLEFDTLISLLQGYDDTVIFSLSGDYSQYFSIQQTGNSVALSVPAPLPSAVIANNHHLIFEIIATKPGTFGARSAISISLSDDVTDFNVLRFERVINKGSVREELHLDSITLIDGFRDGVTFSLTGDHSQYFSSSNIGNVVTIESIGPLPQEVINENTVIAMELEASGPQSISAQTAIVLEIVRDDGIAPIVPVFGEPFYSGSYNEENGLEFDTLISLLQGYDDTVIFSLSGDYSQYFSIQQTGNSVALSVPAPLPSAVIANNHHLIFEIIATKPETFGARSAISISLLDDVTDFNVLRFERVINKGSVREELHLDSITLIDGFRDGVTFSLTGDHSQYFSSSNIGNVVTIESISSLPQEVINENTVIAMELEASGPQSISAQTAILLEIVRDDGIAPIVPVFGEPFYSGSYNEENGLEFDTLISLLQGYDDTVIFSLSGDYSQYFSIQQTGNSVALSVPAPLPSAVIANNHHLIFEIIATKPETFGARSAISISLLDDVTDFNVLRFERVINKGSVREELHLDSIKLIDGFRDGVTFSLTGDHSQYFSSSNIGNVVTIESISPLPQEVINENTVIAMELEASGPQSISAQTAIVLEILRDDGIAPVVPVFGEPFYSGSYNEENGLEFDTLISLLQGYDDTVIFSLSGDYSQYFSIQQTGNSVALSVPAPLPSAVIANNHHLIFEIIATKPETFGARSAISISLLDDVTDFNVLRFERVINKGSVREELHLDSITLIDGFRDGVTFSLTGDHSQYFSSSNIGNVVTIESISPLPQEVINENTVIAMELEASGPQSISAQTAIVLEIVRDDGIAPVVPVFGEPFYSGSYHEENGLEFDTLISLLQGYDDTVIFSLSGDYSQYFSIQQTGNSVALSVPAPLPSAVIANNHHLIFEIIATKPETFGARSAISISLLDDVTDFNVLRFERVINKGSVREELHLDSITLIDGFRDGVTFSLTGDHSQYFSSSNIGNVVTIESIGPLPQEVINENTVITMELEASGPQSISAQTAIVLEIVRDDGIAPVVPVFGEPFYSGSYHEENGLEFDTLISLLQGYDDTVIFSLSGDYSQYFSIQQTGNSVALSVPAPLPSAVIANNHHLIFEIIATKPETFGARSAISISLLDDVTDFNVLRFERVINKGSVREELHLDSITLIDGFRDGVTFSLTGDHSQYFSSSNIGNVVTIESIGPLPQEVINENTVITMELEASGPQSISAQTAIVLEIVRDDGIAPVVPVFGEPFYSGSYNEENGLEFDTLISLLQGYDDTVIFSLSGDYSQYFSIQQTGNSVALSVPAPLPSAVIANNHHLIFEIIATKPETFGASSAISISLLDDVTDFNVLRFERVINKGSVREELHLDSITLIDGFRDGVTFSLTGDHSQYFSSSNIGNVVTIESISPLPQEVINENTVIAMELEASGPQSISAQTAIVLEIVRDDGIAPVVPVFGEPFYSGSYNEENGLEFDTLISLLQGYDDTVIFSLSGDYSQYFSIQQTGNSVALSVPAPLPSAVIANNHHLIFEIIATKPETFGASSAISISLLDDVTDFNVLRFERVINKGSVREELHLDSITLIDGFRDGVTFSLTGDHSQYFSSSNIGNVVTIESIGPLPQEVINENTVIAMELEASGPQSISAQTAIVLEIVRDDGIAPVVPVFGEPFYSGSYNEENGLEFDTLISLLQGYDDTVIFSLSGDYSQYFSIQQTGNSVALSVPAPLPSAVIANNHHLIFEIIATKPETFGASSAISISLLDDVTDFNVLRFERVINKGSVREELHLDSITLIDGFRDGVTFSLTGDHSQYFSSSNIGNVVTIESISPLPQEVINENTVIAMELEASGPQSISAQTAIVLEIVRDDGIAPVVPVFGEPFYSGSYNEENGLEFDTLISLLQGYDDTVIFSLSGDYSQYFSIQQTGNSVALSVPAPLPSAVIANNHHLIFEIIATKPETFGASSAISISLLDDVTDFNVLRFERVINKGSVREELHLDSITLIDGFRDGVTFSLTGDHSQYFSSSNIGNVVTIESIGPLPQEVINENTVIAMELEASGPQSISAQTAIVLEIVRDDGIAPVGPVFGEPFYSGSYNEENGLEFDTLISLLQGYDDTVIFSLSGDYSQYFSIQQTGNSVALSVPAPLPSAVIANNHHLIFEIIATKPETFGASSAISISLLDDVTDFNVLRFERVINKGSVREELHLDSITLIDGFRDGVTFSLTGDHSQYFSSSNIGNVVTIESISPLPQEVINENTVIAMELEASGPQSISAQTAIVLEIVRDDGIAPVVPVFGEPFYSGSYNEENGLEFDTLISLLQGYDDTVIFSLSGDYSQYFSIQQTGNSVALSVPAPLPSAVIANNHHLIFEIIATKPETFGASSAISISLLDDVTDFNVLRFERVINKGSVREELHLDSITLIDGFRDGVTFSLTGDHSQYFSSSNIGNVVTIESISPLPQEVINENTVIAMELEASGPQSISAQTAIVLEIVRDDGIAPVVPVFGEPFYSGSYHEENGLEFDTLISLLQGYDDTVIFSLSGDYSQYFSIQQTGNSVALSVPAPLPSAVIANNHHLIFEIIATKPETFGARSAISISLSDGSAIGIFFDRALYIGSLELGVISHEPIFLSGYTGSDVQISGAYSSEFRGAVSAEGRVEIQTADDASVPPDVSHVALELQADTARTALVLTLLHPASPEPPSVEFERSAYAMRSDAAQSGLLGRVAASASNAETLLYSLIITNGHLEERLSVSNDGELWLSAPASSGVYQFIVRATTVATHVTAEATVHLTVDSVMVCGADNDRVVQPLIVLDRDEEEPHDDLVLNDEHSADCTYDFTYRWPLDKDWLYINERGHLSARAIDREDHAIAFMALSQVQIELILTCTDDETRSRHTREVYSQNRTKRDLGPYDYGNKRWILTEGIGYNARRSFVNIIINDINDNAPIFVDKENEPVVVGYPVPDLLEAVTPSALVTLQATDADIGENAALVYWSAAPELAVSARSGAVHVRDNAARALQSGSVFTISASDLAGAPGGRTGNIDIMVRLLELNNIVVLTVRNALLEDEGEIIQQLRDALQYDIKTLRATVISDEYDLEEQLSPDIFSKRTSGRFYDSLADKEATMNENIVRRSKRQAVVNEAGASLRIFIYALVNTQPIEAEQIISDIESSELTTDWLNYEIRNLEEHLDEVGNVIRVPGGDGSHTGLLVSTIVLSCLLLILIVFCIGWYFVKWRKATNYKQFSDTNSQISSQNFDPPPNLEDMVRPRPKIEDIKRSERRLQEMLDQPVLAPIQDTAQPATEPETSKTLTFNTNAEVAQPRNVKFETISEVPQPDKQLPIVIQSIDKLKTDESTDDEDEFGERLNTKRKSVVTFNEQVEKIIHVDNIADEQEDDDVQVHRL